MRKPPERPLSHRDFYLLRIFMNAPAGMAFEFHELRQFGLEWSGRAVIPILNRLERRGHLQMEWMSLDTGASTTASDRRTVRKWKLSDKGRKFAQEHLSLSTGVIQTNVFGKLVIAQVQGHFAGLAGEEISSNPYLQESVLSDAWRSGHASGRKSMIMDSVFTTRLLSKRNMKANSGRCVLSLPRQSVPTLPNARKARYWAHRDGRGKLVLDF